MTPVHTHLNSCKHCGTPPWSRAMAARNASADARMAEPPTSTQASSTMPGCLRQRANKSLRAARLHVVGLLSCRKNTGLMKTVPGLVHHFFMSHSMASCIGCMPKATEPA